MQTCPWCGGTVTQGDYYYSTTYEIEGVPETAGIIQFRADVLTCTICEGQFTGPNYEERQSGAIILHLARVIQRLKKVSHG